MSSSKRAFRASLRRSVDRRDRARRDEIRLATLATYIEDQAHLDEFLGRVDASIRPAMLERIRPYLTFKVSE